jgi:hypothetical protein
MAERAAPNLPHSDGYALEEGITIPELRRLRALNPTKNTRAADAMHCVPWGAGTFFIVLEAPGMLWVYKLGRLERRRLIQQLSAADPWYAFLLDWYQSIVQLVTK